MPSTYTLNNGIELIGTGEQSGTWGDTTNTNFELLDTALDGQVSVTLAATGSSGSPNTLPISDGASSNGRNRLVIFGDGGDLGGTAFVQLTPNDAEKIIYVRNNLSGSRSILLFQGTYSASNDYEVPAGTTAVVFFNGAGTGAVAANVFNNAFFDSLRLGSVSVDKILDEDNMASNDAAALATQQSIKAYVDSQVGTVDTLAEILANGNTSGGTNIQMTTTDELQFRDTALKISSSADGQLDIDADTEIEIVAPTVDIDASTAMTIDTAALTVTGAVDLNTSLNVDGTVTSDGVTVAGNLSVDGGTIKLDGNYPTGSQNVALGDTSLDSLTSGGNNTGVGHAALTNVTTGSQNVALGAFAGHGITSGQSNIAIGKNAINSSNHTGNNNIAVGNAALNVLETGTGNTGVGESVGIALGGEIVATAIVSGVNYTIQTLGTTDFTLIGASSNTVGSTFTATGAGSGTGTASANANYNTFVGHQSGDVIVGGSKNSILGRFDGNQGGLDIRNSDNHIVLSDGDGNPRLYIDGSGNMAVDTDTLYVDSANDRVGVNVAAPAQTLHIKSADPVIRLEDSSPDGVYAQIDGAGGGLILSADGGAGSASSFIGFRVDGTALVNEAMRIDSSQRVLINTTSTQSIGGKPGYLQVRGTSGSDSAITIVRNDSGVVGGSFLVMGKSRGNDEGDATIVSDGDTIGTIRWAGADGTDVASYSAQILGGVDGTPAADDMPGSLLFETTASGAASSTQRMKISSTGKVTVNTPSSGTALEVNVIDNTADGFVVKQGSNEYISVDTTNTDEEVVLGNDTTNPSVVVKGTNLNINNMYIDFSGSVSTPNTAAAIYRPADNTLAFSTFGTNEAMRIDSSQHVLIGHTSGVLHQGEQHELQVSDTNFSLASFATYRNGSDGAMLALSHSRNTTKGSQTILNAEDNMGGITFFGSDGTDFARGAQIRALVDGTPGNNDMPGRIIFATSPAGTDSPVERMRIHSSGDISMSGSSGTVGTLKGRGSLTISDDHGDNTGGAVAFHYTGNGGYSEIYIENNNTLVLNADPTAAGSNTSIKFRTDDSLAAMIDSSQRVLIGSTSARANFWNSTVKPQFQIEAASDFGRQMAVISSSTNSGFGGVIIMAHQKSGTVGGNTMSANGDTTGTLSFQGNDGTQFTSTASIDSQVDGTPGVDDMPGRLVFKTVASGATSATERMRIDNTGRVMIAAAAGNVNSPTTLMGDMNAYLRVGNSGAQIGTLVKYTHGPNANVDGAVFQLRTGTNGNAAYLKITCTNYQGVRESIFFANNASGTWNLTEVNVADYGGNSPNFAVTTGTTNPTVTVSLPNTSYSGGFLDVTASPIWQLTLA